MPSKRLELSFIVAIPVPRLDRYGRKVAERTVRSWKEKALRLLGACFGGAIATRSAGPYRHQDGTVVFDRGQWVVQAGCPSRKEYLTHRGRVEGFAEEMGQALDQEAVFVLAYARGDSVVLFLEEEEREEP